MSHSHPHEAEHVANVSARTMGVALAITGAFLIIEVVGGLVSHSLALLSDAGHMLVDVLALAISLWAIYTARRPSTSTRTYGFHRVEIMAALANGTILVLSPW